MKRILVRFAPSPTGPLHIGGVRTALYNYLFAKQNQGDFLLRIEDTDQNRFVPGAEAYIMEALRWCGIQWDEGPDIQGAAGPYRQSERKDIYRKYALQLLESGHAYYAFDTPEELEQMRKRMESEKSGNPQYDCNTRMQMRNSLTLAENEVVALLGSNSPYVIRYKMPEHEEIQLNDMIRGDIRVSSNLLDDKVLFKSDGMPTYHLANVVDDYLMQITHVIRGEEWLPSAPLHVMLYKSLGLSASMPQFAHLPLLLKPDGNGKLSKRDGDRLGFPVFPIQWNDPKSGEQSSGYRESGYLPGAFVNMLAMLGWNPGTDQEIFSIDDLVANFSLSRVNKSGAKFDPEKAKWFNQQYLKSIQANDILPTLQAELESRGIVSDPDKIITIFSHVKERMQFAHEFWDHAAYFFIAPKTYDQAFAKRAMKPGTSDILLKLKSQLEKTEPFTSLQIHDVLINFIETTGLTASGVMPALRLALVGQGKGPDLAVIMELIGQKEAIERISRLSQSYSD